MSDYAVRSTMRSAPARPCMPALLQTAEVCQYREMEHAFRASGGIVNSDEVVTLLCRCTDQPISRLARWIVAHEVLSFQWQSRTMLPLFQFDLPAMTLRPSVIGLIRELVPVLSDWEICLWFAAPNGWLADAAPVDAIMLDPAAVVDAARAERYLTRG